MYFRIILQLELKIKILFFYFFTEGAQDNTPFWKKKYLKNIFPKIIFFQPWMPILVAISLPVRYLILCHDTETILRDLGYHINPNNSMKSPTFTTIKVKNVAYLYTRKSFLPQWPNVLTSLGQCFLVEACIHSVGYVSTYSNTLVTALIDVFTIKTVNKVNISRRSKKHTENYLGHTGK